MIVRRLFREPLVHFILLGAALFALAYGMRDSDAGAANTIVITQGHADQMIEGFTRTWQRPPQPAELRGLIDEYIKEEILYREAVAMGLDRDDTIIRRRMRQKMEFLFEDISDVDPTESELQSYLEDHANTFRTDGRVSFSQIYVSRDRRGDAAVADAEQMLASLADQRDADVSKLGDPFLLPSEYTETTIPDVARSFGSEFADALVGVELDTWVGPIESSYGYHLVLVRERGEGRLPVLDEIRPEVEREWRFATRREAETKVFEQLRARYTVMVDLPENMGDGSAPGGAGK